MRLVRRAHADAVGHLGPHAARAHPGDAAHGVDDRAHGGHERVDGPGDDLVLVGDDLDAGLPGPRVAGRDQRRCSPRAGPGRPSRRGAGATAAGRCRPAAPPRRWRAGSPTASAAVPAVQPTSHLAAICGVPPPSPRIRACAAARNAASSPSSCSGPTQSARRRRRRGPRGRRSAPPGGCRATRPAWPPRAAGGSRREGHGGGVHVAAVTRRVRRPAAARAGVGGTAAAADGHDHRRPGHRVGHHAAVQPEHLAHQLLGHHVGGRALGHDPAVLHGDEVVGVAGGLVEVVQHQDDGAPLRRVEVRQQVEHLDLVGEVEEGRRLVEQQQVGALGQRHGDPHPLPLPAGQLVDRPARELDGAGGDHGRGHGGLVLAAPLPQPRLVRVAAAGDQVGDRDAVRRGRAAAAARRGGGRRRGCAGCGCRARRAARGRRARAAAGPARAAGSTCRRRWPRPRRSRRRWGSPATARGRPRGRRSPAGASVGGTAAGARRGGAPADAGTAPGGGRPPGRRGEVLAELTTAISRSSRRGWPGRAARAGTGPRRGR